MTMRNPSRWQPLAALLTPRSMRTVLLIILLLFLILPIGFGILRYQQYRGDLLQQATVSLAQHSSSMTDAINRWQSNGTERITLLSEDPDINEAALQLKSSSSTVAKDSLMAAILGKQQGALFSDMIVVDASTNKILTATNPSWIDQSFPVLNGSWNFPYTQLIYNSPPFSGTLMPAVAAPIRIATRGTGLILVGFLDTKSLSALLVSGANIPPDSFMYLVNTSAGWRASRDNSGALLVQPLPAQQNNEYAGLPLNAATSYTNAFNAKVLGYAQSALNSETRILVEENVQVIDQPAAALGSFVVIVSVGLLIALALATVAVWYLIVRPIIRLNESTNRIIAGQMDESPLIFGTSEYVSLASGLNKITRILRNVSQFMGAEGQINTRKMMTSTELNQSLIGVTTLEETMRVVTNLVLDRMGFLFSAIYLVDEAGQFAVLHEASGPSSDRLKAQGQRFPLGSYTIIGSVAQTGQAHNAANTAEDPMYVRNDLIPDSLSETAVPIRAERHVLGVLDVHASTGNAFSPDEIDLLQSIADQAGMAIENVQAIEATNLNNEVSQQLIRTSRMITMATQREDIYRAAVEGLKSEAYLVAVLDAEGDHLRIVGFHGPTSQYPDQSPISVIPDSVEMLSRLLPSSQPLILKVLSELSRLPPHMRQFLDSLGCRTVGILPLRQGERLIGAILLASTTETALNKNRVRAYMPLIEQVMAAIERLDLIQSTQNRLNELIILNRISQLIAQALDVEELYSTVHEQVQNAIGECDVIFALYQMDRDLLFFPYAYLNGQSAQLDPMPQRDTLFENVISTGQPLLIAQDFEARADALGVHTLPQSVKSWMGVPLITANQVMGVLVLQDPERENRFSENDLRLLATISSQIATSIRTSTLLLETERKAIQLQTAADIARETIGLLDLDILLSHSVNLIRDRFGFYHSSVFLVDNEQKYAVLRESTGEAGRQMKARGHKLEVGSQSIVGWVTENARPRVADDVAADPMHRPNPLLPATRAEVGIPMKIGEKVVGVLDIQSTIPYNFSPDDITILQVIADQITVALENARLFSQTREYLTRHRSLYQVTASAAASTTVDNALFSTAQGLTNTMPGSRVAIYLLSPEKDTLIIRAHTGFESREIENLRISLGEGIPGWVATNRQPSLVTNTATDSRYLMIDSDVKSELSLPLIHHDDLLGVLDVQSARSEAFSEDDVQLLGTVASSLSAILYSTILFEQVAQERERLRQLYEEAIGMAGPPSGNMESQVRKALERMRVVSAADCVAVAFPTDPNEARIEMCTCEPQFRHLAGMEIIYGQDVIGKTLLSGQVMHYSPSTGESDLSRPLAQAGVKSALALPLQWGGRMLGALLVNRMSTDRPFSNEETQLASLLALQLAASMESARLFDQTRQQAEREHLLFEITSRIRRSVDMQGILTTTASELSKALGARRATIKIGGTEGSGTS
jgi:GAF domain-containing protein